MKSKTNRLLSSLLRSSEYQPDTNDYEAVTEIALDSLTTSQHLLIQTANSTYSFSVTDPVRRLGLLIGGALTERGARTFLAGARSRRSAAGSDFSRLRVGSRAVFLVSSQSGLTRMITSAVTRLARKRTCGETKEVDFDNHRPGISEATD